MFHSLWAAAGRPGLTQISRKAFFASLQGTEETLLNGLSHRLGRARFV